MGGTMSGGKATIGAGTTWPAAVQAQRFHGIDTLDATRVGRDAIRIGYEVIAHRVGLIGSN